MNKTPFIEQTEYKWYTITAVSDKTLNPVALLIDGLNEPDILKELDLEEIPLLAIEGNEDIKYIQNITLLEKILSIYNWKYYE